ncbi:MAG: PEP-CTERM sorting domain-containing protein [Pirellulales bacterium]|nr:PEP-CTERM sorting domain-containing protein [Pirellulales bacterium]
MSDPPSNENISIGFRLASPVAVPEPSTLAMLAAGLGCSGYGFIRRRRLHRSGPNISPRPQISRRRSAGHR